MSIIFIIVIKFYANETAYLSFDSNPAACGVRNVKTTYLDVKELLSEDGWAIVDWLSGTVEDSSQHFNAHWHSKDITGELTGGGQVVDVGGSFENLQTQDISMSGAGYLPARQLAFP